MNIRQLDEFLNEKVAGDIVSVIREGNNLGWKIGDLICKRINQTGNMSAKIAPVKLLKPWQRDGEQEAMFEIYGPGYRAKGSVSLFPYENPSTDTYGALRIGRFCTETLQYADKGD